MNKPIASFPDPINLSNGNREMTPPKIPPDMIDVCALIALSLQ